MNTRRHYKIMIILWSTLLFLSILMLISNMVERMNSENLYKYIIVICLLHIIFIPGILLNIHNLKIANNIKKKKRSIIIINILQLIFISCGFIGIIEAGFDSQTTVKQVRNLIEFVQKATKEKDLKSINIEINNSKEEYEIGDEIKFDFITTPKKANLEGILYKTDNDNIHVDLANKKIKCLNAGTCNVTFYDSHNESIYVVVTIKVKDSGLVSIDLGKEKDIFISLNEEYQLKPIINTTGSKDIKLHYESSNIDVAIVSEEGTIIGLKPGYATIKCYFGDIYDEVFVCVNPITQMSIKEDKLVVLSSKDTNSIFKLYVNNIQSFNAKYLQIEYSTSYNIVIKSGTIYEKDGYISCTVINKDSNKSIDEVIKVKLSYVYPGGFKLEDEIDIVMTSGYDLSIDDVDSKNTTFVKNVDLYYYNNKLITSFINSKIKYNKTLTSYKIDQIKVTGDNNLNFEYSTYDNIVFTFNDENNIKDKYVVKFYPSINSDNYLEFTFNINKKEISNLDTSFEMNNLYEQSEGLKNEIWYTKFDKSLFESVTFNNKEFKNSGLMIIPSEKTTKYIDFEISDFGIIKTCKLINRNNMRTPAEVTLEFDICSLYEYKLNNNCKKFKYIINIRSEYDEFLISLNNGEYVSGNQSITVIKDEVIDVKYKLIANLENKMNFSVASTNSILKFTNNSINVISSLTAKNINTCNYGEGTVEYSLNNLYCENRHKTTITITVVNEDGIIPTEKHITTNVISYENNCEPIIEKHIYSTGAKIQLGVSDGNKYLFTTSNSEILSIDNNGIAICLKPGDVIVTATNQENKKEIYTYSLKIFTATKKVEILQDKFVDFKCNNNKYSFKIKNNVVYSFKFNVQDDLDYIYKTKEYEGFKIYNDGSFNATESGTYTGYIQVGETGSPYMYKIQFTIVSDTMGLSSSSVYFIRKLIGHFGLFMAFGIFGMLALFVCNCFNLRRKFYTVVILPLYGFLVSYTTEYIQGLDPTRTNAFKDVMLNLSGYICGMILVGIIFIIVKIIKRKK